MNLFRLKRAHDIEVEQWLTKAIPELTIYQREKLRQNEIIRFSPFEFYKSREDGKCGFLWRLTIIPFGVLWLILFVCLPVNFLITGRWGYGRRVQDFYYSWLHKLNIR